ncbi:hypothetical protein BVX95_02230 [archaeon D22]|nr:hypothetical protein BVX95_02230 [archaeon D22]
MIKKKMELSCHDMGMKTCNFVAKGKTKHKVEEEMIKHAAKVHPEVMEGKSDAEMKKMLHEMDKMVHAA